MARHLLPSSSECSVVSDDAVDSRWQSVKRSRSAAYPFRFFRQALEVADSAAGVRENAVPDPNKPRQQLLLLGPLDLPSLRGASRRAKSPDDLRAIEIFDPRVIIPELRRAQLLRLDKVGAAVLAARRQSLNLPSRNVSGPSLPRS